MKTLNDYMAISYRMEIVEDKEEGGFVVFYLDLPGCITCGETIESAVENAQDAKKAWLEAALEEGIEIHEPVSLGGGMYIFQDIKICEQLPKRLPKGRTLTSH